MKLINFNNSNIGEIDNYINRKYYDDNGYLIKVDLNIQDNLSLTLIKYKNDFPLILDEIKHYFGICKTFYNIVVIDKVKYLAFRNLNEISLKEYKSYKESNKEICMIDARAMYVFYYLMCIKDISLNEDNSFYIRPLLKSDIVDTKNTSSFCLISIDNKSFYYFSKDCKIPISIIKEWFDNSLELFYKYVGEMVKDIDVDKFKFKVLEIVKSYDENYISWVNAVTENLRNSKIYSE
jgi:hypothetical protein